MAGIFYDTKGTKNGVAGSVVSWPHTVGVGTNGILFAYFFNGGTAPPIGAGSLKYAGTAMTLLASGTQTGDPFSGQMWYLSNPPAGLGTFNGTFNSNPSGGEYDCLSESYFGVNTTSPIVASAVSIGTSNSTGGSVTNTTLSTPDWWAGFIAYDNNTGTVATGNFRGTAGSGAMLVAADSTGGTLRWTNSNNTSNFVAIGAELRASAGLIQTSGSAELGLGSTSTIWPSNTTTGNLIIVGVTITNATTLGTVSSISDSQGNSYVMALSGTKSSSLVSVIDQELWYATNITGGAGSVVVLHTADNCAMFAREYNGFNTLDVSVSAIGSSGTAASGTVNTNFGSELMILSSGDDNGTAQTYTVHTPFKDLVGTTTTLTGLSMGDALSGGTAAQSGKVTLNNAANWVALFATFYNAGTTSLILSGYKALLGVGR